MNKKLLYYIGLSLSLSLCLLQLLTVSYSYTIFAGHRKNNSTNSIELRLLFSNSISEGSVYPDYLCS